MPTHTAPRPHEGIPPNELYRQIDTAEAASFLGLAQRTLELHRQAGTGPAFVRAGKRAVRYRLADLLTWQNQQLRTNTLQTTRPTGGPRG
jgi:predicted DNA-binding transcriptional regulator AlpA